MHQVRADHNHALNISAAILTCYAIIEAIAGYWSGSLALLSDAGHMATDVVSLILAALAQKYMRRPASHKHSFGHGRLEVIAALANGLFNIAIVIPIVVEAVERLHQPQEVNGLIVSAVSLLALVVTTSSAYLLTQGAQNLNTRAALLHLLGDILGSLGALIAGAVIYFTGWMPIDPILSIFICILIVFSTIQLLKDTFHILMEGVPPDLDPHDVADTLKDLPDVLAVHDLHIWSVSSGEILFSAHIIIKNFEIWPQAFTEISDALKNQFGIEHFTLQPELQVSGSCQHCNTY